MSAFAYTIQPYLDQALPEGLQATLTDWHPGSGYEGHKKIIIHKRGMPVKGDNVYIIVTLEQLSGNCGMAHLHGWSTYLIKGEVETKRVALRAIEEGVKRCKYTMITTGINRGQQDVRAILEGNGWVESSGFRSRRTHTPCFLFHKILEWSEDERKRFKEDANGADPEDFTK